MEKRRDFIRKIAAGSAGMVIGGNAFSLNAKNYRRVLGANDKLRIAIIGVNGRGNGMGKNFAQQKNTEVASICDVDERALGKAVKVIEALNIGYIPESQKDLRKVMEDTSIDAIYTATPDHWHAPTTIMGCRAGKHVYVEKPLCHNPREGEMAVEAARKYNVVVQMGAQRRSAPVLTQGILELHKGIIGRVYMAKTWYTNTRKDLFLKPAGPVPSWLDWDLWQGPAPRVPYQEGVVHYNWHWLWNWGTAETLNNGTHEVDVARWGLGVDFPTHVTSVGGRYHYEDDWQTPDTQVVTMDFPGRVSLMWESRSSNGRAIEGQDRGIIFYGENGSLDTGGDSYKVYDLNGKLVKEVKSLMGDSALQGRNIDTPSVGMDILHIADFLDAIRNNRCPTCDVETGYKSCVGMLLANISWRVGRDLKIDPKNGHILGDMEAEKFWSREYEKGWEPKV